MAVPTQQVPGTHLSTPQYTPAQTLSDTTRYLCCAPYVNTGFANRVIEEVVEDEQRAVPPSYGFDLDPVVRHCLRARRLLMIRHAVVSALTVVGLCGTPFFTVGLLALGGAMVARRGRMPARARLGMVLALGAVTLVACCAGGAFAALLNSSALSPSVDGFGSGPIGFDDGYYQQPTPDPAYLTAFQWLPLALGAAMFMALFLFRRHAYTVLTGELAYGAPASRPMARSARVERRLAAVAAAQRGNITVQERDPFLGGGSVIHGWSFAVTLRPPGTPPRSGGQGVNQAAPQRIELDAVEINRRVREAVLHLRDPALPENTRVPGIFVTPHVVADGVRGQGDPLINPVTRMPHSMASDEAVDAIARCPQGGLRYYQRAVVPGRGKAIVTDDGTPVVPGQDLGIEVAAYTHFAIEGGMLYAEFMGTVLAPVQQPYTLVDRLREERVTGRALRDTLRTFLTDVVLSPWWLIQAGWHSVALPHRMNKAREDSQEYRAYDYGARLSVRELAAEPDLSSFLHALDGWKYVKLLDRAISDAVVEFLAENGADTSEFRNAVTYVRNEYSNVTNISGGQQNIGGANASFVQRNQGGTTGG